MRRSVPIFCCCGGGCYWACCHLFATFFKSMMVYCFVRARPPSEYTNETNELKLYDFCFLVFKMIWLLSAYSHMALRKIFLDTVTITQVNLPVKYRLANISISFTSIQTIFDWQKCVRICSIRLNQLNSF